MKNFNLWILTFAFLISSPSFALELGIMGGINSNAPSISSNSVDTQVSSGGGFDAGAFFSMGLVDDFSIEVDGLFEHKSYIVGAAPLGTNYTLNDFHIPVYLRYSLIPLLNVGLGPYWSMGLGNITSTTGISTTSTSASYANDGLLQNDFGLSASLQLRIPFTPFTSFIVDGRYDLGLTNLATNPGQSYKTRQLSLLAGLGFGF